MFVMPKLARRSESIQNLNSQIRHSKLTRRPRNHSPVSFRPFGDPVEPLVHSPERVEAARVCGVCAVDDAVGECERAHARSLAGVGGDVGAGHGRDIAYASRVGYRAERVVVVVDAAGALLVLSVNEVLKS